MLNCYKCKRNLTDHCELFGRIIGFNICPHEEEKYKETEGEIMLKDPNVRYLAIELIHNLDRLDDREEVTHIDEIMEALAQRKSKLVASE